MGFSNEWELSYKKGKQMSLWPWSDLVSYVMRYAQPMGPEYTVLELGCGSGANIPFFKSLGIKYYAIEGSESMVEKLKIKYPNYKNNIICGDFVKEIPFKISFDLIIDRGSITHNTTSSIIRIIKNIKKSIKPNGIFIGIDWFSTEYSEYQKGEIVPEDPYSRTNYTEGPFTNLGIVHFTDKEHIQELFKEFELNVLELKVIKREIPDTSFRFASWNFLTTYKR